MTISEQSRHAMYLKLEDALGQEAALILMEHLPPVGWADVATKRDLDHLHVLMQRDLAIGMAELRAEMAAQTRTMVFAIIAAVVSVSGLTLTATQIS